MAGPFPHQAAFDVIDDGILIYDSDTGALLDVNEQMCALSGYTRPELLASDGPYFVADALPAGALPASALPAEPARLRTLIRREADRDSDRDSEADLDPADTLWRFRRKDGSPLRATLRLRRASLEGALRVVAIVRPSTVNPPADDESIRPSHHRLQQGSPEELRDLPVNATGQWHHEEQLRHLVETVADYAIFMIDPKGHVVSWNTGAERIKGYTRDEILGRSFSVFYRPDEADTGRPAQTLRAAARDGQWTGEGWRIRKDGIRFWALVTITALHGRDGQLRGFTKITRDLTERRRREEALRESERRYRRLFEEAQEGIAITTPAGQIVDINPAGLAILGFTQEDLKGLNATSLYVDPEARRRGTKLLMETGVLHDFEVQVRRKDGTPIVCQLSSTARRGQNGAIETYHTFFRDITEEKRARTALEESEVKFRTLAEEALVGIALLQDAVYRYVNPAFARIVGYAPDEIIDRSPALFFHPDDWPSIQEDLNKRFSGASREAHYEARIITRSGELRIIEVMGHRFMYQDKPSIIGTVLDVTDQRRLEEQLLKIQEEERRRVGRELHDGVASELTGAGIMTTVMTKKAREGHPITPEELAQVTSFIKNSTQEIRMLSRGLSPVGLDRGLPTALEALTERTQMRSEDLDCTFEATGAAPVLNEETATHLYRIAQEAIGNAVKHADAQHIRVRLAMEPDALALTIRDDGRGGTGRTTPAQEGLGMRTMRYRAHLTGSALTIDEAPGGGTRVQCRLPTHRFQSAIIGDSDASS